MNWISFGDIHLICGVRQQRFTLEIRGDNRRRSRLRLVFEDRVLRRTETLLTVGPIPPPHRRPANPFAYVERLLGEWATVPLIQLDVRGHPARWGQYCAESDNAVLFRNSFAGDASQKLRTLLHEILHATGASHRLARMTVSDYATLPDAAEDEEATAYLATGIIEHRIGARRFDQSGEDWMDRLVAIENRDRIREVARQAHRASIYMFRAGQNTHEPKQHFPPRVG